MEGRKSICTVRTLVQAFFFFVTCTWVNVRVCGWESCISWVLWWHCVHNKSMRNLNSSCDDTIMIGLCTLTAYSACLAMSSSRCEVGYGTGDTKRDIILYILSNHICAIRCRELALFGAQHNWRWRNIFNNIYIISLVNSVNSFWVPLNLEPILQIWRKHILPKQIALVSNLYDGFCLAQ